MATVYIATHKMVTANSVEPAVRLNNDEKVFDSSVGLFLIAAISRTPTVIIPIIEKKMK